MVGLVERSGTANGPRPVTAVLNSSTKAQTTRNAFLFFFLFNDAVVFAAIKCYRFLRFGVVWFSDVERAVGTAL